MSRMRAAIKESALAPAQITELTGVQRFSFGQNFIGFAGHFPEYPILPAVLQVLLAQLLAEEIIGSPLSVLSLTRAKFLRQLRPEDQIEVHLSCRKKDTAWACRCELQVDGQSAASFTLNLGVSTC
ncbi:3-hydroxyacyl-[acyl-carrier-protein] dehydratase [Desulfuromusa kysingii]|uniref:3-hydroxyacyl-[acyl-carrier-protein] dehydratase n=1 Tax=Desulfuromusa kysingii TaxID=37625 RepID=A0A1H3VP71_9BACT|nr:3-hydroxyacyl-ACP dehydratase [Desulfuromusa kysingii]SDZ76587.1 3-hydroxyacyl-[acyl-carrier-protein] dehydratase [Desulfuromusa kysingii]